MEILGCTAAAGPRIITVNPAGGGDVKTLNAALCQARPGDTIVIAEGSYLYLDLWRDNLTVKALNPKRNRR